MRRIVFKVLKWFGLLVVCLVLLLVAGVAIVIGPSTMAFRRTDITDILVRDGRYDPAEHFTFDRACASSEIHYSDRTLDRLGYEHLDSTVEPDPDMYWQIELVDDHKKTYRILYGAETVVSGPGLVCNSRITLRTETRDGHLAAYVVEASGQ